MDNGVCGCSLHHCVFAEVVVWDWQLLLGVVLFSATYYALESGARVFLSGGICTSLNLAWTYSNFSFKNVLWFLLMFIVTGLCRQSGNLIPAKLA